MNGSDYPTLSSDQHEQVEAICSEYEGQRARGTGPTVEACLERVDADARPRLLYWLLSFEIEYLKSRNESVSAADWLARFPAFPEVVERVVREATDGSPPETPVADSADPESDPAMPRQLGRYRIQRRLGGGSFGTVYSAFDSDLGRRVAVKVPHDDATAYGDLLLDEARHAAQLEHPNAVPVYDVQTLEDGRCFIVSRLIDGTTLGERLESSRPALPETVSLLTSVARALHAAHEIGLVHRDVKPGNILIDSHGTPFLADFGLALPEAAQRDHRGERSGTPLYMSPEQVRGDSEYLDGRSDIWSLGVILYEMLTGRRPFGGSTRNDLFDEILNRDPKPPRMTDTSIPLGVESVCLRALSKSPTGRFSSAHDFAEALIEAYAPFETYTPNPIHTSQIDVPSELDSLRDRLARNVHDNWARLRIEEGWTRGPQRNDDRRQHPGLVPYELLPQSEKDYDVMVAEETIKVILSLGYRIERGES